MEDNCHLRELICSYKQLISQYPNERTYKILLLSIAAYWSFNKFLVPVTDETFAAYYKRKAFNLLTRLPKIGPKIQQEIEKTKQDIHEGLMKVYKDEKFIVELGDSKTKDEILELVKNYQNFHHINWQDGRMSGAVYLDYSNQNHLDLMRDVCV